MEKIKIIISDCHLSAGRVFENKLNPHEDFHFDEEMCEMFRHFSTGAYGETPEGPVDVELFINGDYFDFLNVPYYGEFEDVITEEIALYKTEAIIKGHPKVMQALREFAARPGKKITYLIGNHDADLFFPKVRERIIREWDPAGKFPSEKVRIITEIDHVQWPGGVVVHHGNQLEAVHVLDFERPLHTLYDQEVLKIPWGSYYVLKIVNRLKTEREYLDKVRPVRVYIMMGMLFDPWFTLKYVFLTCFYFIKTRLYSGSQKKSKLRDAAKMLKQETRFLLDLEREARKILDENGEIHTVIFGHTHLPMQKVYPDGKQYINTGTWTKMINLDWRTIGQRYSLTFAMVKIPEDAENPGSQLKATCELRQWMGEQGPHRIYRG